jgi:zinc protease
MLCLMNRFACCLVILAAGGLSAQQVQVASHTLANGMRVLIHEDHDIPNIAMYLFFKIGSRDERPGATGMSHFFEHMMFNGAKKYGPKQFDIEMEKAGGRNNAYTSNDLTVYTNWFPTAAWFTRSAAHRWTTATSASCTSTSTRPRFWRTRTTGR